MGRPSLPDSTNLSKLGSKVLDSIRHELDQAYSANDIFSSQNSEFLFIGP